MSDDLPSWFWDHLVMEQWINQTLCVRYFNRFIEGPLCNKPSNKKIHYVLANELTWSWVHLVLDKWFKQKLCVRYYNEMISWCFGNVLVNKIIHFVLDILIGLLWDHCVMSKWIKSDTMCYLIHWIDQGYPSYCNSDISRHCVLAIILRWFWAHLVMK